MNDLVTRLMSDASPAQRELFEDPSDRKALVKARRVGATEAWMRILLAECLAHDETDSYYVARDIKRGLRRAWPSLTKLDAMHGLDLKLMVTAGEVRCPNQSRLILSSSANIKIVKDERGQAVRAAVLDEAQLVEDDIMEEAIDGTFGPATLDTGGWLGLSGTPEAVLAGLFFDVTGPHATTIPVDKRGHRWARSRPYRERDMTKWAGVTFPWSVHFWDLEHDCAMDWANRSKPGYVPFWERALAYKAKQGWADDHPKWVREYLGRWCLDLGSSMYRYDQNTCGWTGKNGPEGIQWVS